MSKRAHLLSVVSTWKNQWIPRKHLGFLCASKTTEKRVTLFSQLRAADKKPPSFAKKGVFHRVHLGSKMIPSTWVAWLEITELQGITCRNVWRIDIITTHKSVFIYIQLISRHLKWSLQQKSYSESGAETGWVLLSSKIVADGPKKSILYFWLYAPCPQKRNISKIAAFDFFIPWISETFSDMAL